MELSVAQYILKSKGLKSLFVPLSKWFINASTYRQYGNF